MTTIVQHKFIYCMDGFKDGFLPHISSTPLQSKLSPSVKRDVSREASSRRVGVEILRS